MESKKLYKCPKCELNYVEKQGEICNVCNNSIDINRISQKIEYYTNTYYDDSHKYITHCHNCANKLDSKYDRKCALCGWLKCLKCGSCGCNFRKHF